MKPSPHALECFSVHASDRSIPEEELYAALREVAKPTGRGAKRRWTFNTDKHGLYKFTDQQALDTAEFDLLMGHPIDPILSSCLMRDVARRLIRLELATRLDHPW